MPARTPDQQVQRFELRPGAEFKRLRGMNRSADPASIPDDQFHLLTNVRLTPAGMTDRPGLLFPEHESAAGEGCITGMVEIDEMGVGLWLTPSAGSATYNFNAILANLNEEKTGVYDSPFASRDPQLSEFRRYNDLALYDPPSEGVDGLATAVEDPNPRIGYYTRGSAVALIKYRKRLLHLGTRVKLDPEDPNELNPASLQTWACLWEVKLPEDEETPFADYVLYQDLWQILDVDDEGVTDMVTVFGRNDDQITGDERIAEHLFIGRGDGKVFDFDGTTVQETLDMGGAYKVRLSTVNEVGVYAIGTDVGDTATIVRYLDGVGGTWANRTAPYVLNVNDLTSFAGAVYVISSIPSGSGWAGARIFKASAGGNLAFIYELPAISGTNPDRGGLFFSRSGFLFVVGFRPPAGGQAEWHIYRNAGDTSWFQYPENINWFQDFGAEVRWVLPTAKGRTLFGGVWVEKDIGQGNLNEKEIIAEVTDWTVLGGNTMGIVYYNPIPTEIGPTVGSQALILAPEDIVLNEEEL